MLKLEEEIPKSGITGEIFLKMTDADGNVIREEHQKNLIVTNGLLVAAGVIASVPEYSISQFAFGDGTDVAVLGDEDLQGDYFRKIAIDSDLTGVFGSNVARVYWDVTYNDDIAGQTFEGGIGGVWPGGTAFTIKEFGLYATNDTLFNRLVWSGADLELNTGVKVEGYFQITITSN